MFIVLCDNFNFCFWPDPWAEPFGIKYGNGLSLGLFQSILAIVIEVLRRQFNPVRNKMSLVKNISDPEVV